MAAISKSVDFDVLDDIVDDYHNTYQKSIKMKPIDVKPDFYAEHNVGSNEKDPKFKVDDHVRIPENKNIFAEGYTPDFSEKIFVIKKITNTVPWAYVISDLTVIKLLETFIKKTCGQQIKKNLRYKN